MENNLLLFLGPYPFTARASECSDMDLEHVSDENICRDVLSQYYNISTTYIEDNDNYPPGCYCYGGVMSELTCFFNENDQASPRKWSVHSLCKAGNYLLF